MSQATNNVATETHEFELAEAAPPLCPDHDVEMIRATQKRIWICRERGCNWTLPFEVTDAAIHRASVPAEPHRHQTIPLSMSGEGGEYFRGDEADCPICKRQQAGDAQSTEADALHVHAPDASGSCKVCRRQVAQSSEASEPRCGYADAYRCELPQGHAGNHRTAHEAEVSKLREALRGLVCPKCNRRVDSPSAPEIMECPACAAARDAVKGEQEMTKKQIQHCPLPQNPCMCHCHLRVECYECQMGRHKPKHLTKEYKPRATATKGE